MVSSKRMTLKRSFGCRRPTSSSVPTMSTVAGLPPAAAGGDATGGAPKVAFSSAGDRAAENGAAIEGENGHAGFIL